MELTKLRTELRQLHDKQVLFEKYYPVTVRRSSSYDKIERFDHENVGIRVECHINTSI